jgi:hypothetical protein
MKKIALLFLIALMPFFLIAQDYTEIKTVQLPSAVKTYIDKNMPGGTISRAAKGTDKGKTVYAAIIEFNGSKRIMIFDEEGKFIRRASSLTDSGSGDDRRNSGPDPTDVSNTHPHPTIAPTTILEDDQIPTPILDYLNGHLKNYKILQAKQITMGTAPSYQLIIRDQTNDYVFFFNSKGEFTNKRTYIHKNSPFKHQFPLTTNTSTTKQPASEEDK